MIWVIDSDCFSSEFSSLVSAIVLCPISMIYCCRRCSHKSRGTSWHFRTVPGHAVPAHIFGVGSKDRAHAHQNHLPALRSLMNLMIKKGKYLKNLINKMLIIMTDYDWLSVIINLIISHNQSVMNPWLISHLAFQPHGLLGSQSTHRTRRSPHWPGHFAPSWETPQWRTICG